MAKAIHERRKPFLINVSCGSSILGNFDHIEKIRGVITKYGGKIWLHVDGGLGGSVIFSHE